MHRATPAWPPIPTRAADGSILSYLRTEPGMTLVAYSPLLNGAYTRPDKELVQQEIRTALGLPPYQAALHERSAVSS